MIDFNDEDAYQSIVGDGGAQVVHGDKWLIALDNSLEVHDATEVLTTLMAEIAQMPNVNALELQSALMGALMQGGK